MTVTAHALVGGAIAAAIPNPVLGVTLAIASHPILDMIPHWDEGWNWRNKTKIRLFTEATTDLVIGLSLSYFLFGQNVNLIYFLACLFGAVFWDMMEAPYLLFGKKIKPFYWFYTTQSKIQGKLKLPWGILTQVATVMVVVLILGTI